MGQLEGVLIRDNKDVIFTSYEEYKQEIIHAGSREAPCQVQRPTESGQEVGDVI